MKHKHRMILPLAMIASLTLASSASAALAIVNGDFETTTGYTPGGNGQWRSGIATGWSGPTPPPNWYAYYVDGNGFLANLEHAAATSPTFQPLYQDIGTLDGTSNITLTFDYVTFGTSALNVGIWNGSNYAAVLGSANYTAGAVGSKSITVNNVAGGTNIRIGFWQDDVSGAAAGLDNVAISVTPIPEPSAALLGGLGLLALIRRRR